MDKTIAGAASGETAAAAPKDSQSQVKGQKSNMYILPLGTEFVILDVSLPRRLEMLQSFFMFMIPHEKASIILRNHILYDLITNILNLFC